MLLPRKTAQSHTGGWFPFGCACLCPQTPACWPAPPLSFQSCFEAWQARQPPHGSSSLGKMPREPLPVAQERGSRKVRSSKAATSACARTWSQGAAHMQSIKKVMVMVKGKVTGLQSGVTQRMKMAWLLLCAEL